MAGEESRSTKGAQASCPGAATEGCNNNATATALATMVATTMHASPDATGGGTARESGGKTTHASSLSKGVHCEGEDEFEVDAKPLAPLTLTVDSVSLL